MRNETPRPASGPDRDTASFGQQLLAAFDAVADVPPAEREAAIQALGLECPELERELRALLDRDAETGPLDTTLSAQIQPLLQEALPELDPAPAQIGPYHVLRLLGEGGMGRVYLARRSDGPVSRDVAIKLIRPDRAGAGLLARFEAERRHLAALDHPGICRFIDADSLADGTPYVVMEAVQGEPIVDYCQRHALGLRARVELLRKLLAAVAHAHDRLLLHRDIKPHNVLVTADGQPKLLDFGIAKSIEDAQASVTRTAERFFTPNASAPEQLLGEPAGVACDVYSLGALAYELLSGALPFDFQGLRAAEIERLVLQVAPPLMSERSALPWARELKGDLDAIIATCLRKAAGERYRNVDTLDAELQRWLEGRPVTARAPSWAYRSRLFIRRHRVAVGLSAALVLAIAAFGSGLVLQAIELREQRNLAVIERDRALQVVEILESAFRNADPGRVSGDRVTAREILNSAAPGIKGLEAHQPEVFARLAATMARVELDLSQNRLASDWVDRALAVDDRTGLSSEVLNSLLYTGTMAMARHGDASKAEGYLARLQALPAAPRLENELASARVLMTRSRIAEAIPILQTAIGRADKMDLGPESLIATELRWTEAAALGMVGRHIEAANVLEKVITWQLQRLPPDHGLVARSRLMRLVELSNRSTDMENVAALDQELIRLREAYGPASAVIGLGIAARARMFRRLGKLNEASEEYNNALQILEASLGQDHEAVLQNRLNHALTLQQEGSPSRLHQAEAILRETYATTQRLYRRLAPISLQAQVQLSIVLMRSGNHDDALLILADSRYADADQVPSRDNLRNQAVALRMAMQTPDCASRPPNPLCLNVSDRLEKVSHRLDQ
ncbi:serine/threonine-protein kinase [Aquimonas voraii]|uniref:Serine/threonine protein kinase n=1 Tax=Aquimonas voraii TaxID=265719 RepID=A0A1G6W920_9GAMM|nr:serine/threonine-protein kinase [Aquimonas voraii]SDD62309.1 serine/threonine protein kinase [Aquimonas voraii]